MTFIIKMRKGGLSSGYISSGFFGGTLTYYQLFNECSVQNLHRPDVWPCCASLGEQKGEHRVTMRASILTSAQVGERRVLFIYALLAIG